MAFDFPNNPNVNDVFTAGGASFTWNGTAWVRQASDTGYLPLGGGTLTGPLTLAADPTQPLQAATKQYADTHLVELDARVRTIEAYLRRVT